MDLSGSARELTFEDLPDYLHARISAEIPNRNTALDYFSEISMKCANIRCKKMLLERDIPSMVVDEDLFSTMKDLVEMSSGIRIAFVNRHIPTDEALLKFGEFDGGADFRYFNNISDAQDWLREH
jgi:hypothetical protein